jgi:CheY-like chemotaxis protein
MTTNKPTVLLIDDDQSLVDMYKLKFEQKPDLRFITATVPGEGLKLAKSEKPDLILLDLVLPKQGGLPGSINKEVGFYLLGVLKSGQATSHIPVVIFTNLDDRDPENTDRAKSLGADDYWVKAHYQPKDIMAKVMKIVQKDK